MTREVFGYFSLFIAFVSYIPYARMTIKQTIRPHVFSWIIWGTMNAITFFAQISRGAGAGAWATGFSAAGCFFIAFLASLHGEKKITRSDGMVFLSSLAAIPIWYVTKNPLSAVILLTLINVAAFYPTLRKSWINPHEEMISQFLVSDIKHLGSIFAMTSYSTVTMLYPVSALFLNTSLAAVIFRRRVKRRTA
jgi:hypothetical protein